MKRMEGEKQETWCCRWTSTLTGGSREKHWRQWRPAAEREKSISASISLCTPNSSCGSRHSRLPLDDLMTPSPSTLYLPPSLLILVHLHILEYAHANNVEYDHNIFNPRTRGLRERAKTMEDICYFLVGKIECKGVKTVWLCKSLMLLY